MKFSLSFLAHVSPMRKFARRLVHGKETINEKFIAPSSASEANKFERQQPSTCCSMMKSAADFSAYHSKFHFPSSLFPFTFSSTILIILFILILFILLAYSLKIVASDKWRVTSGE